MPNAKVSEATAKEILRLSELYIDGTIRFSLAAESRAMQLSAVLVASSTALVVTSIGFLPTSETIDRNHFAIVIAMIVGAICFWIALIYSLRAAVPPSLNVSGTYLDMWTTDEDLYGPISEALIGQARVYQNQINANTAILQSNALNISTALKLMGLGPVLALSTGIVVYLSFGKFDKLLTAIHACI